MYLSIKIFHLFCNPCTIPNYESFTYCLPHLKIVLHTTSIIKSCIINITRRMIERGVFFLQPSALSPLGISSFRAHIEVSRPSPPLPMPLVQTLYLPSKSARVGNTTIQLISPHYLSSHSCRSSKSFPPPPSPSPLVFFSHAHLFKRPTYNWNRP